MILGIWRQRQDFWSTEEDLLPALAFGRTFRKGLHCLEETLMVLSSIEHGHNDGKWHSNKSLLEMCVSKRNEVLTPGYKMTVD